MKKDQVKIGQVYAAKVTGKIVPVRITGESRHGGWDAINVRTKRPVRIKSAQRLRSRISVPGADETPKGGKAQREVATRAATGKPVAKATTPTQQRDTGEHAATSAKREAKPKTADHTQQTGVAPRSQLTLEEADKLAKARAGKKASKQEADKPGPMGMVAAAVEVLRELGEPMRCRAIVEAMRDKGLWASPNGKTPEATLHSAIMREINKAVETATVSRFRKVGRGQFALNTGGQK